MKDRSPFHHLLLGSAMSAAMLCASTGAAAAVPGFYMSGTIGQSSTDVGDSDQEDLDDLLIATWNELGFDVVSGDSELDKSDLGFEIALGYQISPYLAVEAAYIDLGKAKYEAEGVLDDGSGPVDTSADVSLGAKGPALSLIGIWPVSEKVSLDARAGAFFGKSTLGMEIELDDVSSGESESDKKTSVLLGVGASWALSGRMSVRLGYTHFADAVYDEFTVGRISLGLKVAF